MAHMWFILRNVLELIGLFSFFSTAPGLGTSRALAALAASPVASFRTLRPQHNSIQISPGDPQHLLMSSLQSRQCRWACFCFPPSHFSCRRALQHVRMKIPCPAAGGEARQGSAEAVGNRAELESTTWAPEAGFAPVPWVSSSQGSLPGQASLQEETPQSRIYSSLRNTYNNLDRAIQHTLVMLYFQLSKHLFSAKQSGNIYSVKLSLSEKAFKKKIKAKTGYLKKSHISKLKQFLICVASALSFPLPSHICSA